MAEYSELEKQALALQDKKDKAKEKILPLLNGFTRSQVKSFLWEIQCAFDSCPVDSTVKPSLW